MKVDWTRMSEELGGGERGGTDLAERALDSILGIELIHGAIDHYINHLPGFELARSFLIHVRSPAAMDYCYRLYKEHPDIECRRAAVELLRMICDRSKLPWVDELLEDPDPSIQALGASMLDQLLFAGSVDASECAGLLTKLLHHPNAHVRHYHSLIMQAAASA
ncbi:hypothetical protein OJ996_16725 [Luteolibacter sp. GHJ8]|uniref:HEAT repeat domain-containing protein n=1 Tax=Luteolibacter rhizosphaerae TaxID=2989719 RepID=A0ABT3G5V7_9BACT|nr:HEAT repeat domain-containing protein [Luteolibacter rhizosphaerae]MCW1915233.1 hypothetical protein [Luteolibacter rhizosphaerae]